MKMDERQWNGNFNSRAAYGEQQKEKAQLIPDGK